MPEKSAACGVGKSFGGGGGDKILGTKSRLVLVWRRVMACSATQCGAAGGG